MRVEEYAPMFTRLAELVAAIHQLPLDDLRHMNLYLRQADVDPALFQVGTSTLDEQRQLIAAGLVCRAAANKVADARRARQAAAE